MADGETKIDDIENRIQCDLIARRVKLYRYFQDRDGSASGFLEWHHFQNCLSRLLDITLTPSELAAVKEKYDTRKNDTFNYRLFCKLLEGVDTWYDSRGAPINQALSTPHPMLTHSPVIEESVKKLLVRISAFYRAHAIDMYGLFLELDNLHQGLVPYSQFLRAFQAPPGYSESDVKLIMQKYQAPEKPGYFDYVSFANDLEWMGEPEGVRFRDSQRFRSREGILDLPPSQTISVSIKQIIDKVMRAVYKYNVHLYDFLNVYDTSRSGIITPSQFEKGLWLAIGNESDLISTEIHQLASFFRNQSGQIPYREFCNVIDSAFLPPNIQTTEGGKSCCMDMDHPHDKLMNVLSEEEERRYQDIINRLSRDIDKRQLNLLPCFHDFENEAKYPGLVTAGSFSRCLSLFDIALSPAELQLICRKFEDPSSGGIYFNSFLQDIDKGYQRFRVYRNIDPRNLDHRSYPPAPKFDAYSSTIYDVYLTLRKIRFHVLSRRLRISEFFRDYDVSNTGTISKSQFIRGLDLMLIGSLNHECRLTPDEIEGLTRHYHDPVNKGNVLWRRFEIDIDAVFETRNLEKSPTIRPEPAEYFNPRLLKDPLPLWTTMNTGSIAMEQLRQQVRQRNLNMLTYFRDFDKALGGRVNLNQFDRTMKQYNLQLPDSGWDAIKIVYSDARGFNYRRFLNDLQPPTEDYQRYPAIISMLKARLAALQTGHPGAFIDLLDLICRLRTTMRQNRLLLLDYMREFDKIHRNLIPKILFRKALSLASIRLTDTEYELLEKCFESPETPDHVDYMLFYDMVNSVFTMKNLEKSPLTTPFLFQAEPPIAANNLGPEDDKALWSAMHRMGRRLRQQPCDLPSNFRDYDKTHSGCVSRTQFRRVLDKMGFSSVFTEDEFDATVRRFQQLVGNRRDVNYRAFCYTVEHLSKNDQGNEFWQ